MQQKRTRLLDMRELRHFTPKAVLFATARRHPERPVLLRRNMFMFV